MKKLLGETRRIGALVCARETYGAASGAGEDARAAIDALSMKRFACRPVRVIMHGARFLAFCETDAPAKVEAVVDRRPEPGRVIPFATRATPQRRRSGCFVAPNGAAQHPERVILLIGRT